jgi:hypothetical protein
MVRAICISVDYGDVLELTLPYHKSFVESTLIVTAPHDTKTIAVAEANNAQCHVTDAFYRRGAKFNKWAALEEGLDVMLREGWLLIIDADIVIPPDRRKFEPVEGYIYTPHRRIKYDIGVQVPEQRRWAQYRRPMQNEEFAGYMQLFHASDPVLGNAPWHGVDWTWAGSADSFFHSKWPEQKHVRPPFEVLHLGHPFRNWCGRVTPYADGSVDPKASERAESCEILLRSRKTEGPLSRFIKEKLV